MPILDTEKILNGTDTKQIIHAYENLKSQYSDETARDYRTYYIGKPLSFIVKNAKYIIPEPQFGLPFVRWVAKAFPNPYRNMIAIKQCIEDYWMTNREKMHPSMEKMYADAVNEIGSILKSRSPESATEMCMFKDDVSDEFFDNCYAALCKKRLENNDECATTLFGNDVPYAGCNDFDSYIKSCPHQMKVMYMTPYAKELCLEGVLCESYSSMINENSTGGDNKATNLVSCETVQNLVLSERFMEAVNQFSNIQLRTLVNGMIRADIADEIVTAFKEAAEDTINPVYDSSRSAVNAIMEESVFDEMYKEERASTKAELLNMKHDVYESVRQTIQNYYVVLEETDILPETELFSVIKESMGIEGPISVGDAFKLINEAVSEVEANESSFFEKAGDGSANKIIQRSHRMYREIDEPVKKGSNNSSKDSDDEDALEEEDDEAELPKSTRVASDDLPDSSNPNATNSKPQKVKEGFLTKVQNKAMDAHKNSRKNSAKLRQTGTAVKNAGTAVLKIPAGLLNGLKDMIQGFDKMDDDRRKAYMMQPGYRKKVIKNLRVAATYGLAWHTKKMLIPVVWFGRKLSKEKNKRIRNEFARELDTEIKVTEAKIEDAMAAGDQKQRYQLIRIRDELARQKERVSTNGKYI